VPEADTLAVSAPFSVFAVLYSGAAFFCDQNFTPNPPARMTDAIASQIQRFLNQFMETSLKIR
jgi:hypothetical protein